MLILKGMRGFSFELRVDFIFLRISIISGVFGAPHPQSEDKEKDNAMKKIIILLIFNTLPSILFSFKAS